MQSLSKIVVGLAVLVLTISACSTDRPALKSEFLAVKLPPAAVQACARPQRLPARDLSQAEVARYWARDRAALKMCEAKRVAAVESLK